MWLLYHKKEGMTMTNIVTFDGKVMTDLVFSHRNRNNDFYTFHLSCKRLSGVYDEIPVVIRKDLAEKLPIINGLNIRVTGRFQSYNSKRTEDYGKRILYINAYDVSEINKKSRTNQIELDGIICKPTTLRLTPKGKWVSDVVIKNYSGKNIYYIPCVVWGSTAKASNEMEVGEYIKIKGRIQSRDFIRFRNDKKEMHTAYEISVCELYKEMEEESYA